MAKFTVQPIKPANTAGFELARARQDKHLSLNQVASRLHIPSTYLAALEAGYWEALPKGDYGRYFLRQYAKYLGLDSERLLAQYPGPNLPRIVQPPKKSPIDPAKAVHPMRRLILVVVVLALVVYLIIAAREIFLPPVLTITSPAFDVTTTEPMVVVAGITEPGIEVTVNSEPVEVNELGRFLVEISLRPGLNNLTVKARKNFSREITEVRRIFYSPPIPAASP